MIEFFKYHGAGNDFVIIDDRKKLFDLSDHQLIKRVCDRHFGVGADGLMLLRSSSQADFEMIYFNSDGRLGSMCGNGGRCIVSFARSLNMVNDHCSFLAADGMHQAVIHSQMDVSLQMQDVESIELIEEADGLIDTGSPHYVVVKQNIDQLDVVREGMKIRYNDRFREKGVNVNFIQPEDEIVRIRTYERGVENETLACGTGVTAAAIYAVAFLRFISPVKVKAVGGDLVVSFDRVGSKFINIWKRGPVALVFKGKYEQ